MSKITIVKNYRNTVTLRQMDMSEIVQTIQGEAYGELCRELRRIYPLVEVRQKYDAMDGLFHLYTKDSQGLFLVADGEQKQAAYHESLQWSRALGGKQPRWF